MVIVVVTQEDDRDWRQCIECDGRRTDAAGTEEIPRSCALGKHRVGQDVSGLGLNQECRVANERHHCDRAVTRAAAASAASSTRAGHRVRRARSKRGTEVNGCNGGPVGLKNRRPSK